ncbi:MAG TPA: PLP-dependent aminotransferase family protein [Hyphomicrobium sp.]|jgi:GntR family transcriptional regulator/MocR family aminotransferase|nr:PLP-dependent aminotransferase family protein [Hyphomicrobium sp.]
MRSQFTGTLIALLEEQTYYDLPVGVRIQNAIRRQLGNGSLKAFERLPSTRLLSKELSVARETVELAYQHLEAEGYLIRRHGSGTFVSETGAQLATFQISTGKKARSLHLSERGKKIQCSGRVQDPVPLPFAAAFPDVRSFPIDLWKKTLSRVSRRLGTDALGYCDPQGLEQLREEIARYLGAYRGVRCRAENVIVLTSSQEALLLITTMMLDAGDTVAVEDPCYLGIRSALAVSGAIPLPINVDDNGMIVENLIGRTPAPRGVYVTPSHQYPTTATLSLDRRMALVDWANANRRFIIEDDYDSEYRYDGAPISCIQGLDTSGNVLYVGTFTKTLFPGVRLAYLVAPTHLMPALVGMRTLVDGHSAVLNQATLAEFMATGEFTAHIRRMRQLFKARRDAFVEAVERYLSPFGTLRIPAGGFQATWYLRDGRTEDEVMRRAEKSGIALLALSGLFVRRRGTPGFVLGFAGLTSEECEIAIKQFARVLKGV